MSNPTDRWERMAGWFDELVELREHGVAEASIDVIRVPGAWPEPPR